MRVWEVSTNSDMIRAYFFTTKKEADAFAKKERAELIADGYDDSDMLISIEPWDIKPNRAGIVQALNDLLDVTGFNEG